MRPQKKVMEKNTKTVGAARDAVGLKRDFK